MVGRARRGRRSRSSSALLGGVVVCDDEPVHWHLIDVDGSKNDPDRATIEGLLADGKLLWLDMNGVDDNGLEMLGKAFGIHPLALEDVTEFGQRPKIENYGDVTYLVSYGAKKVGEDPAEVHCFYSERFLVTVRTDHCVALNQLREYVMKAGGQLPGDRQPTQLVFLHHVLDTLIDSYFPMLAEFDDRIDDLQARIFTSPTDDDLEDLFSLQRSLMSLRKLVTPQRDMMASIVSGVIPLPAMTPEREPYVRDLYDHLIRISDLVDSYRDVLSNAMDAYLSVVSNNLNVVMKQLTIIATVFLPLSFLTGFFGQNFGWMVDHIGSPWAFIGLGLGTELVAIVGLFTMFRVRGWIGPVRRNARGPALIR
jgi:magnesium transporter